MKSYIINKNINKKEAVKNFDNPEMNKDIFATIRNRMKEFAFNRQITNRNISVAYMNLGHNGRIGNQFFQIASTIGIAVENRCEYAFPKWICGYTNKEMSNFFKYPIINNLEPSTTFANYHEPSFTYNKVVCTKNTNLIGYFQSEKYFKNCESLIRYHFSPSDSVLEKLKSKYGDLLLKNTCSIHIRRGDYVDHKLHDVCDPDYYKRAIKYIEAKKKIDKFLIFSDDIEWCKKHLHGNYVFIDGNLDIEDLFLMSMCENNIISNSSFSWWASWLNINKDKSIIAPTKWFVNSKMDDSDLYTNDMIKL